MYNNLQFVKNFGTKFKILGITIFLFFGLLTTINSQFNIVQTVPIPPISVCTDTVTFELTILTQDLGGSTGNTLTFDYGPGAHYVAGSIIVTATQNLSSGIPPAIVITESDITNQNVPIFVVTDLVFADQFTLQYKLALDCSVIEQPVASNFVYANFTGSAGTKTNSSDQYNSANGVMNILPSGPGLNQSPNLSFANAIVGQSYTRILRVRNGGSRVNKFMFYDTTQVGLSVMPVSGGTVISTTTVGNTVIRVYEITDFTGIGNFDTYFNTNETVEIIQDVTIVSCTQLLSRFGANYGCYGATSCGSVTGSTRLGGASLNPSVQPNLTIATRKDPLICLDQPLTGYIILKNIGTDAASNVNIQIYKSVGTSASNNGVYGYLDTASISYTLYNLGVATLVDPNLTNVANNTTPNSGASCGYNKPRQASLVIPLIPAGDSVVIKADFVGCCTESCVNKRYIRDGIAFLGSYVNGCNTSPRNLNATQILPRIHFQQEMLIEAPTDIVDGEIFSFYAEVTRYFNSGPISPFDHIVEFKLPDGIMFSGDLNDIELLRSNGTPYVVTPPIVYDMINNTITFTFDETNQMQQKMKFFFNNLMGDCSKGNGGNIEVSAVLETDPSCSCRPTILCQNVSIVLHCPDCLTGGMINHGFDIYRTNIGPSDINNNGIPDDPQQPLTPFVKYNYAVHADTLESEFTGFVRVTSPTGSPAAGFTYGYAIDSSQVGNKLIPISGRVVITKPGGTTFTCNNLPVGSSGVYHWVDFSIPNLSSCGYGPNFLDGDTVRAYITYFVNDPIRYSGVFQYPVKTRYYLSDVDYLDVPFSSPVSNNDWYCDNYSGIFGLAGLYDASNGQRTLTHKSCDTLITLMDYFLGVGPSQYYNGGNFFVDEYRSFSIYDTFTIFIPPGYSYHRATMNYNYTGGSNLVSIYPTDPNANPLVFPVIDYFEGFGGTLPVSDEGHNVQFRTYLVAGCSAPVNYTSNITMRQRSIPIGVYDHFVQGSYDYFLNSNVISYDKPNITISTAEPVIQASSDTVSWQISITNTTPFPADNVWLAEAGTNTIDFISFQQVDCSTGAPIGVASVDNGGGVFETGALEGNSQRCYKVTGKITSCTTNQLQIATGWDCGAYPATFGDANCMSTLDLYATLLESGLNIQITEQPLTEVELCDTVDYEIIISDPNIGRTQDIQVSFIIPGGVGGMEIIPNSSFLKFNATSGNYPIIPNLSDPVGVGDEYIWTIPNALIGGAGLDGTLSAPDNQFRIKFRARTTPCDIRSGIRFYFNANGVSPCGVEVMATQQATQRINLVGALGNNGAFVVTTNVDDLRYCLDDQAQINVNLLYLGSVATDGNEFARLIIPSDFSFVSSSYSALGTFVPTSGPTLNGSNIDGNIYEFGLPAGMVIGDQIMFSLDIYKTNQFSCTLDSIIITETSRIFTATCSTDTGIMCDIVEVTGDDSDTLNLLPASLIFNGVTDTTIVCNLFDEYLISNGGYTIDGTCGNYNLENAIINSPPCLIDGTYLVRWYVEDDCGNQDSLDVNVTLIDTVPPVFYGIPDDITIQCASQMPVAPPTSSIIVTDDCSLSYNVSIVDEITNEICDNRFVLLRHFISENECGRKDTSTQVITVYDDSKPIWMIAPQDLVVDCDNVDIATLIADWETNYLGSMAVDGCGGVITYTITSGTAVPTCGGGYITQYSINAADDCGNNVTGSASLTVVDNADPVLTVPVTNTTISCEDDFVVELDSWSNTASATDGCGGTVTISYGLVSEVTECVGTATVTTYTYMFTATDECGNVATGESNFIVEDATAPAITAPADLNIACGDPAATMILSWLEDYTVTEACSDYTVTNNYDGTLPAACGGSLTVTWTVTDGCGASATATSDIIMAADNTIPVFSNCPSDMTVNVDVDLCAANVIYSTPVATDCNGPVTVALTSGIASGQEFPPGDTDITFTATDACNNTADCTFTITVEDSQLPSIVCPVNEVTVCTEETTCEWSSDAAINATFNDNCTGSALTYDIVGVTTGSGSGSVSAGTMFALGTSTVTYTVTAANNQTATCSFDVVVEDCTDPVITCPADLTLECGVDVEAAVALWNATSTDNCSTTPVIEKEFIYTNLNCCSGASRLYLFTATDEAGNSAECFAQVNIEDTTPPVVTPATSVTEECSGDADTEGFVAWLENHGGATATDACGDVSWSTNFTSLDLGCGNSGIATVTFTATDECGNTSSTTATYTIEDTTPPVVTAPPAITLECGDVSNAAIITSWLATATATDICGEVTITNDYVPGSETLDCTGASGLTVTYTATDACSNTSTATSVIYIIDTTDPEIEIQPTDLYVECTDANIATALAAWEAAYGNAIAVDECDANLTLSFTAGTAVTICGGSTVTPYTFTATDACDNSVTTYATLTIYDNTAPVLTLPTATASISCEADVQTALDAWLASASATDDCGGNSTVTYYLINEEEVCDGTNTETIYTYLFEAEDECGNSTYAEAEFTVYDDVAPIITAPADLTVSCGDDIGAALLPWLNAYTVTEACQNYTVTNDYDGTIPDLCGGSLTVTWTVTDDCGASGTATADLIVSPDNQVPVFLNCPGNLTVTTDVDLCGAYVIYSTPVAVDCNIPVDVVLTSGPTSGTLFDIGNNPITFTATDACGNETECTFTITVIDEDIPMILCPSNDVVVCNDGGLCTWEGTAAVNPIGIENCPGAEITYEITGATVVPGPVTGTAAGVVFNLGTSVVTYTITDGANNISSCSFNVIVEDCEDPGIECNDMLTVACGEEDMTAWFESIASTITDNCSAAVDMTVDTLLLTDFSSCGNTTDRVYLYTVTDEAGNTSTCTGRYKTIDDVPPVIDETFKQDLTLECNGIHNLDALLAWLNVHAGLTATDACSEPLTWTNNYSGDLPDQCSFTGTLTVEFVVTDACGNSNSATASFTIEDTTAPQLTCPAAITLECSNTNNAAIISNWLTTGYATDQCDTEVPVTTDYPGVYVAACGGTGEYTVTFTAEDDCTNISACESTITIEDNTAPAITTPAQDTLTECGTDNAAELASWLAGNGGAEATDACSEPLTWQVPLLLNSQYLCGNTVIYTYRFSVADECGNISAGTVATFTVEDTTVPQITTEASDLTVECNGSGNLADRTTWLNNHAGATATDLCGELVWTWDLINTIDQCGYTGEYTYRFTVTDECGNFSTTEATFTIEDTTAPDITAGAQNMTVECDGTNNASGILNWLNNNGFATASEDCGAITWTNDYGTITGSCGATGAVEVNFTATDECGNASTTTATFTIIDETAPVWEIAPQDLTIECDGTTDPYSQIEAWLNTAGGGEAEDDCSLVVYTNDYTGLSDECGNTGSALVTFTATDACGNFTDTTATVTIVDNTAPTIITMASDTTVECDGQGNTAELQSWLDNHGGAVAEDACSEPLTWNYVLSSTTENCGFTSESIYVFTATDDCGNTSVETLASFIIEDTTSPSIDTEAADETVECDGSGNISQREAWLDNHGGAVASDICSAELVWTWDLINTTDQCGYTGEYTYRFTVTDECGNESTTEATFIIEDTTPPEIITEASNMEVECNGANNSADILNWLNNNGGAEATEACGSITWTNDYGTIIGGCGTTGEVEVTFTATDECGNASTTTATFTINDNTPPVWEIAPQDLTIECDGTTDPYSQIEAWLDGVGGGEAEDSCSLIVYTNDYTGLSDECGNTGSALVTFTATDACGNFTDTTATVTIVDNTAPEITIMARDTVVECDGQGNTAELQSWLDIHGGAVATDLCSEPLTWEYELISTIEGCGGTSVSRYAFRATDDCGNVSVNTEATFTIEDTTLPVFDVLPQDSIAQCDGTGNAAQLMGWLGENAGLIASDLCSGIENISFDLVKETDLCGLTASYLYRFTIVDGCGNENTAEATFTIVDTLPPVITGGADMGMEECQSPPAGNYPEFDYWLEDNAGATAEDGCGEFSWSNDFAPENWQFACGNTKYVDVWFYATDVCGNVDSVMFTFSIGDVTPPVFTNCPRPDVVVDVPTNLCESYVNFSMPYAEDNCSGAVVEQTDTTGYSTGDLFPVGCTMLEFTATDSCGNQTVCRFRVIVNDNHTDPIIECPSDTSLINDPGLCGAVLEELTPYTTDNCPGNVSVIYQVFNESNVEIASGIETASGMEFPVGNNTVKYTVFDQPIFLITEVVQDGTTTGVEIGNIGPAAIDLGCARIRRTNSSADEEYMVPSGTVVTSGSVFVQLFTNIPAGEIASYSVDFVDRLIDSVSINDGLDGVDIFRISPIDTDTDADFMVVNSCQAGSFGAWNPQLPFNPDNGTVTKLQSVDPNMSMCTFNVNVQDVESPVCSLVDTLEFSGGGMTIDGATCVSSVLTVGAGTIADINLIDLNATVENAGLVTVTLTSPSGQQITLIEGVCNNTSDIDVALDDVATSSVLDAGCSPLGNGNIYAPVQAFTIFFGEEAAGDWTLELYSDAPNSGTLNNWTLQFLLVTDYDQQDIVADNDPGLCGAEIQWLHPYYLDNCINGTMTVTYSFSNEVTGESYETEEIILSSGGAIDLDGTLATRYFEVGVTEVTYTLTDVYGNTGYCGFTVTVNDTEAPTFPNGCQDVSIHLDPGDCYGSLTTLPLVDDNCAIDTLYFEYENGDAVDITQIGIGENIIYAIAEDIYGNKDTCIFIVNIIEYIPDNNTLACNDEINVSLDGNCEAVLNADMLLEGGPYRCYDNYCIEIVDSEGNPHVNYFDYDDIGETFMATVTDCLGSGISCMTIVNIMEKFIPELECPNDTVVTCNADIDPAHLGIVEILNCEPFAEILHSDEFIDNGMCGDPRAEIIRTWSVNDHQGNIVSCEQHIVIMKSQLDDVVFPADVLDLDCAYAASHPQATHPSNTGYPTVEGIPINYNTGLCMFSFLYTDEIYNYCGSSYEILRTWKVRDMCGPVTSENPRIHIQVIKVFDTQAPVFHECADITVDASAYECSGAIEIPVPMIMDNCNDITLNVTVNGAAVNITGNYSEGTMTIIAHNMGLGNHPARFIATDECNNKKVCQFNISVVDNSPPIPVCEQFKQVSLTSEGSAKVFAYDFDSGSFDNCQPVYFKVLRVNSDLNYDGGCEDLNGDDSSQSGIQVWYDDEVYFCCDDVGTEVMVNMRVFDVDPEEGPVSPSRMASGGDLYGHYNDCWSIVKIECKVPPTLVCEDITISCEESLDPEENEALQPDVLAVCGYELTYTDIRNNGVCESVITRTWTATGCDKSTQCKQKISVTGTEPFDPCTIVFPADKSAVCSNEIPAGGQPIWDENPCNVVTAEIIKEDTFRFVEDACYKIIRQWAVIDWCVYEQNTGAELNIDAVTSARKLNCNQLVEDGYYRYSQILMLFDNTPPQIEVADTCIGITDCYAQNITLTATASDTCNTNEKFNWKYIVVNMDTWETVQYSYNYTPVPSQGVPGKRTKDALDEVKEGKLVVLDPLPIGNYRVTWTVGDGCGNATSKEHYFTIADKKAPTPVMVDIATAIMVNGMVELRARWFDKGGCGDDCISSFDNCTPSQQLYFTYTPVLPDLETEPQKWAQQLLQYGMNFFDPLTGKISTQNNYLNGSAHAWLPDSRTSQKIWFCDYLEDADTTLRTEIYVWDQLAMNENCDDNNYDVAIVDLNLNHCGSATISGTVRAEGEAFEGMEVRAYSTEETYTKTTDQSGYYEFDVNPENYNIEAMSDDDFSKGITTLDIVIIQKYILGLKQITDPYILMAGDVNMNNKLSASDIVELRRLILGAEERFTNNSWVGVNAGYEFDNPLRAFEESEQARKISISVAEGQSHSGLDFNAIKIGDMNKSYLTAEFRSSAALEFMLENEMVHKGQSMEIPVYAKDFSGIYGFQCAINIAGLENVHIKSAALNVREDNMNIKDGRLMISWNEAQGLSVENDEVLFIITAQATEDAMLSSIMNINDTALRAEAYSGTELSIRNVSISYITYPFALYQNQPNPFSNETLIGFDLPENCDYELKVYDVTGKEIYTVKESGKRGYNKVTLKNHDILNSGVYYYKLSAKGNTDTKKMVFYR